MKKIKYNLPDITSDNTITTSAIEVNDLTISVNDASSFSANDIVLIEERGCELNEIRIIDSIATNNITFTTAIDYPHLNKITITKLNYDEYKIEKAVDGTTYTDFKTGSLDYANVYNKIEVLDDTETGSDNSSYKVSYRNSVLDSNVLQATLHKEDNFSFIGIDTYRSESKFTTSQASDAIIATALYQGVEWIQDNAYNTYTLTSSDSENIFSLDLDGMNIADWFGEGEINTDAIIVYEEDTDGEYLRYSKNHTIKKVFENTHKVVFSEKLPTSGRRLTVEVPVTFKKLDEIKAGLRSINKLIATNYILMNVDTSKIKGGVTGWTAGGTSVNRDVTAIKDSIDKNISEANRILSSILKIYMRRTKLRTRRSSLNKSYGFRTQGGVLY